MTTQLGGYVKRRRRQRGWTRAELARTSGVPYSTLSNIERNEHNVKPQEETLEAIAQAFGEDAEQIKILAGYNVIHTAGTSERAQRIDALMIAAPRWAAALLEVQKMPLEEQDQALTALEVHIELVRRRRRAPSQD